MILMIDNYDSFTYNLVQYLKQIGEGVQVKRNDAVSVDEIAAMAPQAIVISPGPGRPESAGISVDTIRRFSGQIPILGVCLGHQSIAHVFGGRVIGAKRLMHGKTSAITGDGKGNLCRHQTAISGHALPQPGGGEGKFARLSGGDRHRGGWRDHGDSAPVPYHRGDPVSPRIHHDPAGKAAAAQFFKNDIGLGN